MNRKGAFILPAYNERESIYQLILDLYKTVPKNSLLVIVDDSHGDEGLKFINSALLESGWDSRNTKIIQNPIKSGRGYAVKIGLNYALGREDVDTFVEMDSDGSHSALMALKVANEVPKFDFCVGSRYLPESQIIGWAIQRRIFSKLINLVLGQVFGKEISDWTNGLRAYSRSATKVICERESLTTGFIYLSEQAVILTNGRFLVSQVPITFVDRIYGESTVTWKELSSSIFGILRIFSKRKSLQSE